MVVFSRGAEEDVEGFEVAVEQVLEVGWWDVGFWVGGWDVAYVHEAGG